MAELMSGGEHALILQYEQEEMVNKGLPALRVLRNLATGMDDMWCSTGLCSGR